MPVIFLGKPEEPVAATADAIPTLPASSIGPKIDKVRQADADLLG